MPSPIRSTASPRADPKPLTDFFTSVSSPAAGKGDRFRPMIPSPMENDYWRTRTVEEAMKDYAFLRLTCACGRITDYPFTLLLQRQGVSRDSSAIFDSDVSSAGEKT